MTTIRDRNAPSLPQHDTPEQQRKRAEDIATARETYQWTTAVETLPGVPLATKVPFSDDPSVPWLIEAVKAGLVVVENTLAGAVDDGDEDAKAQLESIQKSVAHIDSLHAAASNPTEALEEGILGAVEAAAGAASHAFGLHGNTLRGHLNELLALAEAKRRKAEAEEGFEAYAELFHTIDEPAIVSTFMEDETFARMRVAGPNPMLLTRAGKLPAAAEALDGLADRVTAGEIYVVDYSGLSGITAGVVDGTQRYLYEPVALFDTTEQGSLRPLAIVIGDEVFEPAEAGPQKWRWEMAKFAVQVADGNYHELFVHLARTHLVVEAFVLATHRALAPKHPLSLLLLPHFQGTLFINNSAAGSLIAHGGPIEAIFAGTIETTQLAAADDRLAFDFAANMVPAELETRGVMGGPLTDFPYRDDALRVWNAIETWVRAYVDVYYDSDADVVADTELAAWSAEVMGQGAVQGFTAPHDRSSLALALTMVIFTGSAQHAAVNFPQRTLMTYAPNVTGAVWTPLDGPTTEARWVAMMPPIDKASLQLQTLELLGGVYFSQLGDYKNASFPYGAWFRDEQITRSGGPLERFRNDLREVEAEIEKANADRSVPYPYLLPTQIPQSINI